MKKTAKLLAVVLTVLLVGSAFACGEKDPPDGDNTLDIMVINKGFGTKWLYALAEAFEDDHEGVVVTVKEEYSEDTLDSKLQAGLAYSKYDLFFGGTVMNAQINGQLHGSSDYLENLNDVYAAVPAGESRSIEQKFTSSLVKAYTYEDAAGETVRYTMPWVQNVNGLLCNNEAVEAVLGANWQTRYPCRTTDELVEFCQELDGKLPAFIHCADKQYYHFLYETWWAQYEGLDEIENFYKGLAYNAQSQKYEVSTDIFLQPGRLEAISVLERLLNPVNGFDIKDSNGFTWNQVQMNFMSGKSAMFSNGDWNNLEMGKNFPNNDVRFLKMPVISALGEKLGIDEAELRAAVTYADGVLAGKTPQAPELHPTGKYSAEEVLAEVCAARRVAHTTSQYFSTYVASYGLGKELAKEFLVFMASDRGQRIFTEATGGLTMPYGYDLAADEAAYANYSQFAKSRWEIVKHADYFYNHFELPLGEAGLLPFEAVKLAPIEVLVSRLNKTMSAEDVCNEDVKYYGIPQHWTNLLRKAGLA